MASVIEGGTLRFSKGPCVWLVASAPQVVGVAGDTVAALVTKHQRKILQLGRFEGAVEVVTGRNDGILVQLLLEPSFELHVLQALDVVNPGVPSRGRSPS
jgi:hypothetical protein